MKTKPSKIKRKVTFNENPFKKIQNKAIEYNQNTVKCCQMSTLSSVSVGLRSSVKIMGIFGNVEIQIVFDSGSTICGLSADLASKLSITKTQNKIFSANNEEMNILGEAETSINLGGIDFPIKVKIIRNLSAKMVLGTDFAAKYKAQLNFKTGKLNLEYSKNKVSLPMKWNSEMKNTSIFAAATLVNNKTQLNCAALHIRGYVNNTRLPILIDSGSCTNLISRKYVGKKDIFPIKFTSLLKTANGRNLNILGATELKLTINGVKFRETAFVAESLSVPIIMGNFFLEKYDAKVEFSNNKLSLQHPDINDAVTTDLFWQGQTREILENSNVEQTFQILSNVYEAFREPKLGIKKVTVANTVTIGPFQSKRISIKIKNGFPAKQGYLSFIRRYRKHKDLIFEDGVYYANKYLKVMVSNRAGTPYMLNKFEKIGTFEEIEMLPLEKINQVQLEDESFRANVDRFIIDKKRTESERKQGIELLTEYIDIFQFNKKGFKAAQADHPPIILKKTSDEIKARPQYPSGKIQKKLIDEYVQELKDQGAVVPSDSPYNSPLILVKKKSSGYRVCLDYRACNKILQGYSYPIPRISDILSSLNGTTMYSVVDLFSGFSQLKLAEGFSQDVTSFSTDKEHLKFVCLSQGLSPAPSHFQSFINQTFASLLFTDILVYLDDILIFSRQGFPEMLVKLRKFFDICRSRKIKLNPAKSKFFLDEVELLGFTVNKNGIRPAESMVEKVKNFKSPTSSKLLRSILGFSGYFRHHIKGYSKLIYPLLKVLREDPKKFKWDNECEIAFQSLKQKLISRPILRHFDQDLAIEIHTDASVRGIGSCLIQICNKTGKPHAVAYTSRTLTKTEQAYSVSERELLAVVHSCQRWRSFLFGVPFTVVTDHEALKASSTIDSKTGRLSRLAMKLMEFNITWRHKKGCKHLVPDCLSRYFTPEELEQAEKESKVEPLKSILTLVDGKINLENLQKYQREDESLKLIFHAIEFPDTCTSLQRRRAKQFEITDGILYKKEGENKLTVVPEILRDDILEQIHSDPHSGGHVGISKSLDKLNRNFYWKGSAKDLKEFVKTCKECLFSKRRAGKVLGKIKSQEIPKQPMENLCIDIQGPNSLSNGCRYIILASCYLTSYVYLKPIKAADSDCVIEFLMELFSIFGCPKIVQTDRGSHFTSDDVENFLKQMGVEHRLSASYCPWQNSRSERNFSFIGNCLRTYCSPDTKDWKQFAISAMIAQNSTKNNTTNLSPHKLLFGYDFRTPLEAKLRPPGSEVSIQERLDKIDELREKARVLIEEARKKQENYKNQRLGDARFEVNSKVLLYMPETKKQIHGKLKIQYVGPFLVKKKIGLSMFEIEDLRPGKTGTQIVHGNRLKSYYERKNK